MKKLLSDPLLLCLVTTVMIFDGSKIAKSVPFRIPQGTFIPSLVPIGPAVSEKTIFEGNNIKNSQKKKNIEKGQ